MHATVTVSAKHLTLSASPIAGLHTDVLNWEGQRVMDGFGPLADLGTSDPADGSYVLILFVLSRCHVKHTGNHR